ncbi:pilus assembly protein CpaB [Sinorhizobium fredii]
MKPVRIIILAVAVGSAAMAGLLAMKLTRAPAQRMAEPLVEQAPSINVLVASKSLPVGSRLGAASIHWMAWPKDGVADGMITEESRPAAIDDLSGAVVRLPLFDGEPLRQEKIADPSNRIMSSLLPAGKRAVATEITVATGAGGFILPNDRVDVIMVRKSDGDVYLTETVLSNVRVLAIDQQVEEKDDGSKSVIGTHSHTRAHARPIESDDGRAADGRAHLAGSTQRRRCPGGRYGGSRLSSERRWPAEHSSHQIRFHRQERRHRHHSEPAVRIGRGVT